MDIGESRMSTFRFYAIAIPIALTLAVGIVALSSAIIFADVEHPSR